MQRESEILYEQELKETLNSFNGEGIADGFKKT